MPYQVQVSIPFVSGLPRDVCTNVLHFDRIGLEPVLADLDALILALRTFYTNVYGATEFSATYADWEHVRFKVYNLADAPPRIPVRDVEHVIAVGPSNAEAILPPEVAVVCSVSTGVPTPSSRGRVYLGALGNAWSTPGTAGGFPGVASIARATVVAAAEQLVGDAADVDWTWVVFSRTLNLTYPINRGFVDDAFDTQRRRGQAATQRDSWTL